MASATDQSNSDVVAPSSRHLLTVNMTSDNALQLMGPAVLPARGKYSQVEPSKPALIGTAALTPGPLSQPMPSTKGGRRRISRACDQCNQLRTKCDGKAPCPHCVEYSLSCTYVRERKKRRETSEQEDESKVPEAPASEAAPALENATTERSQTPTIRPPLGMSLDKLLTFITASHPLYASEPGSPDMDPGLTPTWPPAERDNSEGKEMLRDGNHPPTVPFPPTTRPFDNKDRPRSTSPESNSEMWSETSSFDEEVAEVIPHLLKYLPLAVNDLSTYFRRIHNSTGQHARGNGQEHLNEPKSAPTRTSTSSKRPQSDRSINGSGKRRADEDDDENQASKNPRAGQCGKGQDTRLLACPFAKRSPLQHRKCFKYILQEIPRLKQHLLRAHQIPIHCPRCYKEFEKVEERDHHSRQPDCVVQPRRTYDGINESQRRQLGKRISSKKSREENWYLIYQILFPNASRPESPCTNIEDISLSEELLAIHEFAMQAAPVRVSQFINDRLPLELRSNQPQLEDFIQAAVRDVVDMLLENCTTSSDSSSPASVEHATSHLPRISHDSSNYEISIPLSGSSSSNGIFRDWNSLELDELAACSGLQSTEFLFHGLDSSGFNFDFDALNT